jgi:integrase
MRLEEWTERWVDAYGPAWAERTRIQRGDILDRHVDPVIGGVRLRDLGRKRLVTYRRDLLTRGASAKTVNAVLRVLSACLKDAEGEGLIPGNPLRGVRPLDEPPVQRRAIPADVVEQLVAAMPTDRDRLIVALISYAGLRPSEVRALTWGDITDHAVSVTKAAGLTRVKGTKTGSIRAVPIRPALATVLGTVERGGAAELVAPGDRGGLLDWHNWSGRVWRPAREALGVDYVPYEGRHTYASTLIGENVQPLQVAHWMGHAKPTMTLDTYGHLFNLRDSSTGHAANDAPTVHGDAAK